MRGWEQEVLDPFQRTKHYQLLECLKDRPNQWFSVDELDASLLPSGARLAAFPTQWLEHMSNMCAGRSSRFEMRDVVDRSAAEVGTDYYGEAMADGAQRLSFSIRSVVRAPANQADLLRFLRYPRADTEASDDDGGDGEGSDDDYDLAVLSSAFHGSPSSTFAAINNGCAAGLVLAIPLQAQHKASGGGGATSMFDALTSSGDGSGVSAAGGGVTAMEERMFQQWWTTCPVAMRASHAHGQRGIVDVAANALPTALQQQDTLTLEWRRRIEHPLNRMTKHVQTPGTTTTTGAGGIAAAPSTSSSTSSASTEFARHYRVHIRAYPASAVVFGQPTPSGGGDVGAWHIVHGARDDWAWYDAHPRVRRINPLQLRLAVAAGSSQPATTAASKPSDVRLHVVVEEHVGTSTERICEVQWAMQLIWNPVIERVESSHATKGVYALFRREMEPPMVLPNDATLQCFQGGKRKRDSGEAAMDPSGPGGDTPQKGRRGLSDAWWANVAPSITRSAQNYRPSEADVAAAAAVVVMPVVLHHTLSGAIQTLPAIVKADGDADAASKKRRRKYRDMRNTHMLHMGLNLQQPYQEHLRFKPLTY